MGYVRSAVALSLRSQKTCTGGMIFTSIADLYFGQNAQGAEALAQDPEYFILHGNSNDNVKKEVTALDDFYMY